MEIKFNSKGKLWVDIAACAVWSLFVLIVSGCNFALMNPVTIAILIIGFAGFSYLILKNEGAGKQARIMAVVTILAVFVRTLYVLYTGAEQRQHDVQSFDTDYGLFYHSEYIEYLLNNHKLLNEDIRLHDQFYQPPLTHIFSAVFFGIYRKVAPAYAHNWDALQCLSLFYSLATLAVLKKLTELWDLTEKGKTLAYLTFAFLPQFIYFSGALNNDPLAVLFMVAALYLALIWYNDEKKSFLKLMGLSLCIGLGMMAKLSAGLIAVPIAFVMLKAFFESKTKLKMFFEYVAFLAVCAPLGLWYQVRNYILWKIPITYVVRPDVVANPWFLIEPMPFWKRFFDFGDGVDYNIITETLNSACFDDEYYRDYLPLALVGYLLLFAFTVFTITILINFIVSWIKERSTLNIVFTILLISQLASYVYFCFDYPYICTMSYRYIVPTIIAGAYYSGKSTGRAPHLLALITKITVYAVAIFSFILYCFAWLLDFRTV